MLTAMQQIKVICKILGGECRRFQMSTVRNSFYSQKRQLGFFLNWFIDVFNRVDTKRLKAFGPDCICAEWLLRNGAKVRFKGHSIFTTNYNELMVLEEARGPYLKVEEIYAKGSGISSTGFDHLKDCNHIKKITLIFCSHLTDIGLQKLVYVRSTLEHLELISCFNVKDAGIQSLIHLKNLKVLVLGGLVSVKNPDECEELLKNSLPQCNVRFEKLKE